jgi:hypothetical protein
VRILAAFWTALALASCADRAPSAGPGSNVPDVAEVVCEADGSTAVLTPRVAVQPDGVHLHVVNHLDETASMNGFGFDVDAGETTYVAVRPPGVVNEACWPFSLHGTDEEPQSTPMEVIDPEGLFVRGELQCSGTASNMIGDFAEAPIEGGRVPLEKARQAFHGIVEDDEIFHVGYPEQADPSVAVRRDGQIVATYQFVTFDGDAWIVASSQICSSSGLR